MPHLTPNWYAYANETLMISTTKERVKYRNLTRDNRMSVCIYSEPRAQDYVTLWGRVSIRDDASIWPDTRAIVERYVPAQGSKRACNNCARKTGSFSISNPSGCCFGLMKSPSPQPSPAGRGRDSWSRGWRAVLR